MIIEGFEGELSATPKNISKLEGGITKIYINGISITPAKKTEVSFENNFEYSFLKITNLQTSLEYVASGDVSLYEGKIKIKLDNEKIILNNFEGNLELSKELTLTGVIPDSDVKNFMEFKPA